MQGREPQGIVPPEQVPAVIEELSAALSRFRFKSSGKAAFRVEELTDSIADIQRCCWRAKALVGH